MESLETYTKRARNSVKKLKVSKKVADTLVKIAVELYSMYKEQFEVQDAVIKTWERLYLDQPDDRLWHAKDRTWWRRIHGEERAFLEANDKAFTKQVNGTLEGYLGLPNFKLYQADPPQEITDLILAARSVVDAKKVKVKMALLNDLKTALQKMEHADPPSLPLNYAVSIKQTKDGFETEINGKTWKYKTKAGTKKAKKK